MEYVKALRTKAALCRRVAAVPTCGSTSADRVLIALAATLDHEAAAIERQHMGAKPSSAGQSPRLDA
jgi:hypothetical protein